MEKKELRKKILAVRNRLAANELVFKSEEIKKKLFAREDFRLKRNIMFFLTFGKEVRTEAMVRESLAQGKKIIVPKIDKKSNTLILSWLHDYDKDLASGVWGIPEPHAAALRPIKPEEVDLVIVPGVAFDRNGNRLGYGGGYYDRFFTRLRKEVPLVALAFDCQVVEYIPTGRFDKKIGCLITEKEEINFL